MGLGLGLGLGLQIRNPAHINIVWGFEMTLGNKACSGNNVQRAVSRSSLGAIFSIN
jgi:hypothetical protein